MGVSYLTEPNEAGRTLKWHWGVTVLNPLEPNNRLDHVLFRRFFRGAWLSSPISPTLGAVQPSPIAHVSETTRGSTLRKSERITDYYCFHNSVPTIAIAILQFNAPLARCAGTFSSVAPDRQERLGDTLDGNKEGKPGRLQHFL
jgi:hypothetical protein